MGVVSRANELDYFSARRYYIHITKKKITAKQHTYKQVINIKKRDVKVGRRLCREYEIFMKERRETRNV